jgi:hypothetical protein
MNSKIEYEFEYETQDDKPVTIGFLYAVDENAFCSAPIYLTLDEYMNLSDKAILNIFKKSRNAFLLASGKSKILTPEEIMSWFCKEGENQEAHQNLSPLPQQEPS